MDFHFHTAVEYQMQRWKTMKANLDITEHNISIVLSHYLLSRQII